MKSSDEEPLKDPSIAAVHMLRTVQQHHVQLSLMADQKANIVVGVCLVIVTICLSQMSRDAIPPALMVWGVFALLSAVLGIWAIMPRTIGSKSFLPPNKLFFGGFAQMSDQEFSREMMKMIHSDESIYLAMIRDIHQIGCLLHYKKYRYLLYSYRVFLAGLVSALFTAILDLAGLL